MRKKSWVWKHCRFSEDKQYTICNICNASFEYSGSTSSLNKHLKTKHLVNNAVRNYSEEDHGKQQDSDATR